MDVVPKAAVPFVFAKVPALKNVGTLPAPDGAFPSNVLMKVASSRLLNVAPFAPVKLPALQTASPGFTNLPPSSITLPLMVSPPLATTNAFVMEPPLRVKGPVTFTGLVPPSVPAARFNSPTELGLLKLTMPPTTLRVVPVTLQLPESVVAPEIMFNVEPTLKVPLAV